MILSQRAREAWQGRLPSLPVTQPSSIRGGPRACCLHVRCCSVSGHRFGRLFWPWWTKPDLRTPNA